MSPDLTLTNQKAICMMLVDTSGYMIGRLEHTQCVGILCERIERLLRYRYEANITKNTMADSYGVA